MVTRQVDVLIVGAGISGIGAAYHVKTLCPTRSFAIIEGREQLGGTWDLFRYPGVRSDSDMHTLGYPFRPWTEGKAPWDFEEMPTMPTILLDLWRQLADRSSGLREEIDNMCPWKTMHSGKRYAQQSRTVNPEHNDVIGAYNKAVSLEDQLTQAGYRKKGKRWLAPSSSTRIPGVVVFLDQEQQKCYSHHGSDPMTPEKIHTFFATLEAANPHPVTELEYTSVFELLAAVLLSAQATDVGVNKATRRLFVVANTPQHIIDLGLERLMAHIQTIGLYRTKAANLLKTCHILVNEHGGQVPRTREALERLPGVGRKTANVVLNVAFGEPTMAVDTHIFRVSNRTGLAPGKDVLAVEHKLLKRIPARYRVDAHHWLILHGRYVCQARKPQCGACQVRACCDFKEKTVT